MMSLETFVKALQLVRNCGQRTAWLHNFGEPLLHPDILSFIRIATDSGIEASFYTNGLLLTDELSTSLVEAGLRSLCVSDHVRGTSDRVRARLDRLGLPLKVQETYRPAKSLIHDWAGQVAHPTANNAYIHGAAGPCLFQRNNAAVILWDGRINVCCIDVEGAHSPGSVDDYLNDTSRYEFAPIPLCNGCTLMRGDEDL